jgi:hypothetical protein
MTQRVLSGPRQEFVLLVVVGGLAVLAGAVGIVRALVRTLPNKDVPVAVDITDVPHELLLDGASGVEVTDAVVRVSQLGPTPFTLALAATLLPMITLIVVAACFMLLGMSFYRGDFFVPRCLVAITTAAVALVVGSMAKPTLELLAAEGALESLGAGSGQLVAMGIDGPLFLAGALLVAVAHAFRRGVHLQADTEGLV